MTVILTKQGDKPNKAPDGLSLGESKGTLAFRKPGHGSIFHVHPGVLIASHLLPVCGSDPAPLPSAPPEMLMRCVNTPASLIEPSLPIQLSFSFLPDPLIKPPPFPSGFSSVSRPQLSVFISHSVLQPLARASIHLPPPPLPLHP